LWRSIEAPTALKYKTMKFRYTEPDNFIFALLEVSEAEEVYKENKAEIFKLYNDDTESVVTHEAEILESPDFVFGICIGFEKELKDDYNEDTARHNESRSFDLWLEARINSLIE
jgi:hypothetical protein